MQEKLKDVKGEPSPSEWGRATLAERKENAKM